MVGDHHCFFPLFFFGSYDDVQKLATRKEPKKKKKGKKLDSNLLRFLFFLFSIFGSARNLMLDNYSATVQAIDILYFLDYIMFIDPFSFSFRFYIVLLLLFFFLFSVLTV